MKKFIKRAVEACGYSIVKRDYYSDVWDMQGEHEREFEALYERCVKETMTSRERVYALYQAVKYLAQNGIQGDFVECGVWRGGSSMFMALAEMAQQSPSRSLYLFDTFAGMPAPTAKDRNFSGKTAEYALNELGLKSYGEMYQADKGIVARNMESTGYPSHLVHLVEGRVEETIPKYAPEKIALLRLDTDWYESTYHELTHLYPRLVRGGVVIIDDYGHWQGAREATDNYLRENKVPLLLNRIDFTGRIGVKSFD